MKAFLGSPPRAWGRRGDVTRETMSGRFTPTCVGTTREGREEREGTRVHPHVRGDDFSPLGTQKVRRTVHPHVRGDDAALPRGTQRASRFTPTCVGTTMPGVEGVGVIPVHPHVRGDDARTR